MDGHAGLLSTARASVTVHPSSPGVIAAVSGMDLVSAAVAPVRPRGRRGATTDGRRGQRARGLPKAGSPRTQGLNMKQPRSRCCAYRGLVSIWELDVTDHIHKATATHQHPSFCHPSYCSADEPFEPLHSSAPTVFTTDDAEIELNVLGDAREMWVRLAMESRRRTTGPGSNTLLFCSVLLSAGEAVELRDRLTAALALGGVA